MKPMGTLPPTSQQVIESTRGWVDRVVIGLNLCPFAKAVQIKGQIRFVVSDVHNTDDLLIDLEREMRALSEADPLVVDTTLLIHPNVLLAFLAFNDFLDDAERRLSILGLDGVLQVASFHPDYCFAGVEQTDAANYTNRSPYPMLHLLRESSISAALDSHPDASRIYERNIDTLRALDPMSLASLVATKR